MSYASEVSSESWPEESVRRLEPLIWRAYCIHGDLVYQRPYPIPKPFPTKKAAQDRFYSASERYYIGEVLKALKAEPDAERWGDQDRSDAVAIMRHARGIAEDLYERNCSTKPKEMQARLPGIAFRLCDAYLAYLGATRH